MALAVLNQILDQLQSLNPEELQQLNQAVQGCLSSESNIIKKHEFHQMLIDSGLVQQIKQPSKNQPTERQLIQIKGQSISETILEERR
jgi:hypothetical protein